MVHSLGPVSLARASDAIIATASTAAVAADAEPPHLGIAALSRKGTSGDARLQVRDAVACGTPAPARCAPARACVLCTLCVQSTTDCGSIAGAGGERAPHAAQPHLSAPPLQLLVRPNKLNLRELHGILPKLPAADPPSAAGSAAPASEAAAKPVLGEIRWPAVA